MSCARHVLYHADRIALELFCFSDEPWTWIDHRRQIFGVEDDDQGTITWRNTAGEVVEVTDCADATPEMDQLIEEHRACLTRVEAAA